MRHIGSYKPRVRKRAFSEPKASQHCFIQIRPGEIGVFQINPQKHRLRQIRGSKICRDQARPYKRSAGEYSLGEARAVKIGSGEDRT
jgi:hypothetical protein